MLNKETDKKDDTDESLSPAAKRPFLNNFAIKIQVANEGSYDSVIQPSWKFMILN